ncbi:MAG: DUF4160 domain-containing protein [Chlorobium sp.]
MLSLYRVSCMPEVSRFYGIIVAVFFSEHNPPHFHARYGNNKIAIEINSLKILEGNFPPRALGLVMEWASLHRTELISNWNLARDNQQLQKIEPLK